MVISLECEGVLISLCVCVYITYLYMRLSIITNVQLVEGLAGVLGGWAVKVISEAGTVELPIIGTLFPWQMTFIVVGLPGLLLVAIMLATTREPIRKNIKTATL